MLHHLTSTLSAELVRGSYFNSRDLAIGIVGSMVVCVAIYMAVAAAAIGAGGASSAPFSAGGSAPAPSSYSLA